MSFLRVLFLSSLMLNVLACSKIDFSPSAFVKSAPENSGAPDLPVVVPGPGNPPINSNLQILQGECAQSQALTGCMSCPSVPKPKPLTKGEQLTKIMFMSCQVPNGSDPKGYVPPNLDKIKDRLDLCLDGNYPITSSEIGSPTSNQADIIIKLLDSDPAMRKKLFGGLWFKPPYSDYFETYFGLTVAEARYQFCYFPTQLTGILPTTEYMKAAIEGDPDGWYRSNPNGKAQTEFRIANIIREQLKSCMDAAGTPPPPVNPPVKKCVYKSYPDIGSADAVREVEKMLKEGYSVSAEAQNSCRLVEQPSHVSGLQGHFAVVGMHCKEEK